MKLLSNLMFFCLTTILFQTIAFAQEVGPPVDAHSLDQWDGVWLTSDKQQGLIISGNSADLHILELSDSRISKPQCLKAARQVLCFSSGPEDKEANELFKYSLVRDMDTLLQHREEYSVQNNRILAASEQTRLYKTGKDHIFGQAQHDQSISLPVNNLFQVKLKENPSTGYSWHFLSPFAPFLEVIDERYIEAKPDLDGAPSYLLLTFRTLKRGTLKLESGHARSERDAAKSKVRFSLTFEIQ